MVSVQELEGLPWLEPWEAVSSDRRPALARELAREVPPEHALAGQQCVAVAARGDCDDVLFVVGGTRLAIVHLTWSKESDGRWPSTGFLADVAEFVVEMKRDHEEFKS